MRFGFQCLNHLRGHTVLPPRLQASHDRSYALHLETMSAVKLSLHLEYQR